MSMRGEKRTEFPQKVRKLAFARCCRECKVAGVANIPGVPQCEHCGNELKSGNVEYEHLVPDGLGGDPTLENCGVWCRVPCSSVKTAKVDIPRMAKADSVLKKAYGLEPTKRSKLQGQGFRKSSGQKRASTPVNKWRGF